jgi:hypothetical protein
MSGYLKQKLFQALHDLVGAGDLDQEPEKAGHGMPIPRVHDLFFLRLS